MLAIMVNAPPTNEPDALQGISSAFFATLDREGSGVVIAVWIALALAGAFATVRWLRRVAWTERRDRRALETRREEIARETPPRVERRDFVRVQAHLEMKVARGEAGPRQRFDAYETLNLSGGGLAFLTDQAPEPGSKMELSLELGSAKPLWIRGLVVRVEPPTEADAPSLVALRFVDVPAATRERLVKWIAEEEVREIAIARQGRLCSFCKRPLADSHDEMHSTCATRMAANAAAKRAKSTAA